MSPTTMTNDQHVPTTSRVVFQTKLEFGYSVLFPPMETLVIYYMRLVATFSQARSRSRLVSVTHKCSTDPPAASPPKTSAFPSP